MVPKSGILPLEAGHMISTAQTEQTMDLALPLRWTAGVAKRALKLDRIEAVHAELRKESDPRFFATRAIERLGVRPDLSVGDLERVPATGPVLVVANHPFGLVEGLLMVDLLHRIRPDVRVLANSLLAKVPECHDFVFFVNPFGGPEAAAQNIHGMKAAIRWLRQGGVLLTFPAGEVSRLDWRSGTVRDGAWNMNTARLARCGRVVVVPVHFEGTNSPLFHMAGAVHPRLQTALLPRELLNKQRRTIRLRIGHPIPSSRVESFRDDAAMLDYLRLRVDVLTHRKEEASSLHAANGPGRLRFSLPKAALRRPAPVPPGSATDALLGEIEALPPSQTVLEQGEFKVVYARAPQIPVVLDEIGRLREITFRAVGEGTGRARDLDRFDRHYLHLIVWNRTAHEVVGAYRMGPTDEILPRRGPRGLYTSTLFSIQRPFLEHLGPALELGRSFVRPEYQRAYLPLLLLWKGIAQYVARNPRYRHLYGPVSVSNDYRTISRHLIQSSLEKQGGRRTPLSRWVRPRRRLRNLLRNPWPEIPADLKGDIEALAELVEECENGRGLPVLLRQYLKLGGEIMAFNVDPDFGNTLDGLMLVDMLRSEGASLSRYMGAAAYAAFRSYHETAEPTRKAS